jgi:hypothetical protein
MEFLNDYLVLIVLGICACVGFVFKNVIPSEKVNKFIPLIMAVLGVLINCWLNAWSFTPEVLLGGLASGLASTGAHQAITQLVKKSGDDDADNA